MAEFLLSFILTILIEGIILIILLSKDYDKMIIARNAVIASSLTLPFVWFLFPLLGLDWILQTTASELFAFVVETVIFLLLFTKMSWKQAIVASLLANAGSFLFGLVLL
jgi:hypothetical protein